MMDLTMKKTSHSLLRGHHSKYLL